MIVSTQVFSDSSFSDSMLNEKCNKLKSSKEPEMVDTTSANSNLLLSNVPRNSPVANNVTPINILSYSHLAMAIQIRITLKSKLPLSLSLIPQSSKLTIHWLSTKLFIYLHFIFIHVVKIK